MKVTYRDEIKSRTRHKASRAHQGRGHWHVDIRSNVIVCRSCEARIPKHLNPQFCPECGSGREHLPENDRTQPSTSGEGE